MAALWEPVGAGFGGGAQGRRRGEQQTPSRVHLEALARALLGSDRAGPAWKPMAHEAGWWPSQREPERLPTRHPEGHCAHLRARARAVSRPSSPSADPSERRGMRPERTRTASHPDRCSQQQADASARGAPRTEGRPPATAAPAPASLRPGALPDMAPPRGPGAQEESYRKSTRR